MNPRFLEKCSSHKYWVGICYPENMIEDWKDSISDLLQLPYAYCIHDKDLIKDEEEDRKVHVHIIIVLKNTSTQKHVKAILNRLSMPGRICCPGAISIVEIKWMYDYIIHDTEECRKKGKHLYDKEERIEGNGFDIGAYIQVGLEEKEKMLCELENLIFEKAFTNYFTFNRYVAENFNTEYRRTIRANSGHFDRLLKGMYHHMNDMYKKELHEIIEWTEKREKEKKDT